MQRIGLRWFLAGAQFTFAVILLVDMFNANRQLPQPGSLFGPTHSTAVVTFQLLNMPIEALVHVPDLWMRDQWAQVLETVQGNIMVLIVVTLFWFAVGRWIDRQFGLYPRATWKGNKYTMYFSGLGVVLFGTMAVRFLFWDAELDSRLTACAWSLFACWALITHIRRTWPEFRKQFDRAR